jgi:flagellar biosynthetic protein FlhB
LAESADTSEERELEPTERRLERARDEGQFAQSRDLTTLIVLVLFTAFLLSAGGALMSGLVALVKAGLTFDSSQDWQDHLFVWAAGPLMKSFLWVLAIIVPLWFVTSLAPLAMVKFRPVWAFKMNPDRLDPVAGFGRIFSTQTLTEVLKNILKVIVIFGVGVTYVVSLFSSLSVLAHQDFKQALFNSVGLIETGLLLLLMPIVLVAGVDVVIQWFNFQKRMKMSPEEMKQEMKESEGSPEVKGRIRQLQREIAEGRMMADIAKADVVVVNPTHFAVALRYDDTRMRAPIVVGKGVDLIAARIREVATANKVPIFEAPPLARALHRSVKIGDEIPANLYVAVAQVLTYVFQLRRARRDQLTPPELPVINFTE